MAQERKPPGGPVVLGSLISIPAGFNSQRVDRVTMHFIRLLTGDTLWEVGTIGLYPMGIGEGVARAVAEGWELPTPEMVDALYCVADVRILPPIRKHNGTPRTMSSPETYRDQEEKVKLLYEYEEAETRSRIELWEPPTYIGGHKFIVQDPKTGKAGLYGWHVPRSENWAKTPLHRSASLVHVDVVQPLYTGHDLSWKDYSQELRPFRRVSWS